MMQEDKELLLKDLCARLPYGITIQVKEWAILDSTLEIGHIDRLLYDEIEVKPYLRPMSSMTEEEEEEWWEFKDENTIVESHSYSIDWLNAHHFDYRGLIEKGLALEAPKGMYK